MPKQKKEREDETREGFCGACLAVPLALAGAGAAGVGAKKGGHGKMKKILLWGGVGLTVVTVVVAVIYLVRCKNCR